MNFWAIFFGVFAVSLYLLKTLLYGECTILLGLIIIAWFLADNITKKIRDNWPRKYVASNNKAVFITGCDTGFGHELAKRLDTLGFTVFAGCLLTENEGAQHLKKLCSNQLHIVQVDVTNDESVEKAANYVKNSLNGKELWAIVNNAGILSLGEIEWCPLSSFEKVMNVNAFGPVRVTKAFLPLLRKSCGRVVIVASLAGRVSLSGMSCYCMSKHAAVSFADSLRQEMKKWGISVHCVEPTFYRTPLLGNTAAKDMMKGNWEKTAPEVRKSYGEKYFNEFQDKQIDVLNQGRLNVQEVVEDIMDAIAGENPKNRYVPHAIPQFRAKLLLSLPPDLNEFLIYQTGPKCKTAPASVK